MKSKSLNLLSVLAAFGMIAAGILAIYNDDYLFAAIGVYFIAKGIFVFALMQRMQQKRCCKEQKNWANEQIWTADLFLTKETLYPWATSAF